MGRLLLSEALRRGDDDFQLASSSESSSELLEESVIASVATYASVVTIPGVSG